MIFLCAMLTISLSITAFFGNGVRLYWRDFKKAVHLKDKKTINAEFNGILTSTIFLIVFILISAYLADKLNG